MNPTHIPSAYGEGALVSAPHSSPLLRLHDVIQSIRKRKWLLLAFIGVGIALALVATMLTPRVFRASTSIQIDREPVRLVNFEGSPGAITREGGDNAEFYQTQYELLRSRALAERAAKKLEGDGPQVATNALGTRMSPPTFPVDERGRVHALAQSLEVTPVRNSRLVRLSVHSTDPEFAARAANAFAEAFSDASLEHRTRSSRSASSFLEDRLASVKDQLEESERRLVEFAQAEQIVSGPEGASLQSQSMAELTSSLSRASADRARAEARWRQASAGTSGLTADMLQNSILGTLQSRRAEIASELQNRLAVYTPEHDEVRRLQGQLAEIDRAIRAEHASVRNAAQSEFTAARNQERLLQQALARSRGQELDLQGRSIQYNILRREVDTNRQLYDGLLQQFNEVSVAGLADTNNVAIVDAAEVPLVAYRPSLRRNVLLGALVGATLGLLVLLAWYGLDDRLRDLGQIESEYGLPLLGVIPLVSRDISEEARDARSTLSEAYRSARTALQFLTPQGAPKSLMVTSAAASEGKSVTAFMLGRAFAELGERVLLVDADLRKPTLHARFGVPNNRGLAQLLESGGTMEDVTVATGQQGVSLIPAGSSGANAGQLLANNRLAAVLREASASYDRVIVDGPPILGLADVALLGHVVEGVVVAIVPGESRRRVLTSGLHRLQLANVPVLGAIATRYDRQSQPGYASYADQNYYGYGLPQK